MKRIISLLLALTLLLCLPATAQATGNGNMDAGGGGMGQGTSQNKWTPGNDGVRITVIDTESGTAVSTPMDFSNHAQSGSVLHFGKVSKLQYQSGASLQLQAGGSYACIRPTNPMPTIVSSTGQNNIESVKRYFCSEYACMMVAAAAGMDYDTMISGRYKLMVEPLAYFTHNGQYYCMTATEAALYDQLSGGALRTTMPFLTHKNLSLSMFLEEDGLSIFKPFEICSPKRFTDSGVIQTTIDYMNIIQTFSIIKRGKDFICIDYNSINKKLHPPLS